DVTPNARMTARERLDVYRVAYKARLVDCLIDDYPVLSKALGEERFDALCRAYIDRYPSTSPNLNAYGKRFGSVCMEAPTVAPALEGFDELRGFSADLARLEWSLVEVVHAELSPRLDASALQAIPPDALGSVRFTRNEAVRLLDLKYPVNAYFK